MSTSQNKKKRRRLKKRRRGTEKRIRNVEVEAEVGAEATARVDKEAGAETDLKKRKKELLRINQTRSMRRSPINRKKRALPGYMQT